MPQPLEYNEAMGSPEAHLAIMKNRVDSAKADYDQAVKKSNQAQAENAKRDWEQRQQEYEEFMAGGVTGQGTQEKPETVH